MSALMTQLYVKVSCLAYDLYIYVYILQNHDFLWLTDSCNVNNGNCDPYATCSHDRETFAVVCKCKTGYTNVGTMKEVKCEGNTVKPFN